MRTNLRETGIRYQWWNLLNYSFSCRWISECRCFKWSTHWKFHMEFFVSFLTLVNRIAISINEGGCNIQIESIALHKTTRKLKKQKRTIRDFLLTTLSLTTSVIWNVCFRLWLNDMSTNISSSQFLGTVLINMNISPLGTSAYIGKCIGMNWEHLRSLWYNQNHV